MATNLVINLTAREIITRLLNWDYVSESVPYKGAEPVISKQLELASKDLQTLGYDRADGWQVAIDLLKDPNGRKELLGVLATNIATDNEASNLFGRAKYNDEYYLQRVVNSGACKWCQSKDTGGPVDFEVFKSISSKGKHPGCDCRIILIDSKGNKIREY